MKIGIDARLMGETGVGRYIRNLISVLARIDRINSYIVFVRDDSWNPPNERWEKRIIDIPWHSISEQLIFPWLLIKEHLDLVHIPYFNVPIFYPGKFVITIHDLTILHFDTGKATTLPLPLYKLRRLGYYLALAVGLRRAYKIIAVSQTTKQEVVDHFQIDPNKIVVTYEGVDSKIYKSANDKSTNKNRLINGKYFLYVGNAYPHKNLEILFKQDLPIKLVLVGKIDFFYQRLKKNISNKNFIFFGQATDDQLINLYTHASALVFPSLMEGFGLPALEALVLGCPVIVSDIPVFHEILGNNATYFNPRDPHDLAEKLASARGKRKKVVLDVYSWSTLASDTLAVYENSTRL